jgi:hypothetical protein
MKKKTTDSKEPDDQELIERNSFNVIDHQHKFINEEKNRNKKKKYNHFLRYGYDFAMISSAWAKANNFSPQEIMKTDNSHKLFEKAEFLNNPDIDLIFQIITYVNEIKESKGDIERSNKSFRIISNKSVCRELCEKYTKVGFNFIESLFRDSDKDPITINKLMVSKLLDKFGA